MNELIIVIVSVTATALFGRTYGPRRVLRNIAEQLAVLEKLPDEMSDEKQALQRIVRRDCERHERLRRTRRGEELVARVMLGTCLLALLKLWFMESPPAWITKYDKQMVDTVSNTISSLFFLIVFAGALWFGLKVIWRAIQLVGEERRESPPPSAPVS